MAMPPARSPSHPRPHSNRQSWRGNKQLPRHTAQIYQTDGDRRGWHPTCMEVPTLIHLSGGEAREAFDQIFHIYAIVYAVPPYNQTDQDRASFVARASHQFRRLGFDLVAARIGDRMIGFAYGYTIPSRTTWWDGIQPPQTEAFVRETDQRRAPGGRGLPFLHARRSAGPDAADERPSPVAPRSARSRAE